jgi:hypothetical protein
MRVLLAPSFNYREPLPQLRRGRDRRNRLRSERSVDKLPKWPKCDP